MSTSSPSLAKFSRPRLFAVHKRERVFALLDGLRQHPMIWIAGPPGAGKSTLVASYVEARRLPGIWFQTDAGDGDPATFFHYLGLAAHELAGTKRSRAGAALPHYGPEYGNDLPAFTRRYLREFFALLPRPAVLVVDNVHEAKGDPAWRAAFAEGLREIPEGMNFVFLSRTEPTPEMSRYLADQSMVRLGWEQLRFTQDEADAVTAAAGLPQDVVRAIYRASEGWAAGIVLMREHMARLAGSGDTAGLLPEGKEAVFSYFTGEIFGRARPENQRVLLLSAMLPSVSAAEAIAISGNNEAGRLLDHLYRRHLFVDRRRVGAEPVFHFHALFREFLLDEGAKRLSAEERRSARRRAAELLAMRGEVEAAATLYREAGDWEALARHAVAAAPALLAQGRAHTLQEWLEELPADVRAHQPWLSYWLANALLYSDPARAKTLLAAAYARFEAAADVQGQLLSAAAAVDCHYFEWADFAPLDGWIAVFERWLGRGDDALAPADALRVNSCFLIALLFRQPTHPRLAEVADAVARLLDAEAPVNLRLNAASILFHYYNWSTKGDTAVSLITRATAWLADPDVTPLNHVWWRVHLGFNHQIRGDYEGARRIMEEAKTIARDYNLRSVLFEIYHSETTALTSVRDVAGATAALAQLASVLSPSRRMDAAYFHNQEAGVLLLQGRPAEAAAAAQRAVSTARETGLPAMQIPHFLVREALCHLHAGNEAASLACYQRAIAEAVGIDRRNFALQERIVRAHFARVSGQEHAALALLREALPACHAASYQGFLRYSPSVCAPLFALALEHDIEPTFVRALIKSRQLAPPSVASAHWPWPLALRTLGAFELARDDVPVASTGKAQKKPLELLKALIAHGGRNVDASVLTALVWPDAEGDDAKSSFDSNLYRLRKLLAVEGAVALAEGKLSLNPAVVWLDLWAVDACLDAVPPDVTAAIKLYRGQFLGLEATLPWMLPTRDRLQARLVRAVLSAGQEREAAGDWKGARALYERLLELDNLAEAVYRRLMVCQRELGDPAGALTTYRRCRELLSIVLGRRPAPETETIRESLAIS